LAELKHIVMAWQVHHNNVTVKTKSLKYENVQMYVIFMTLHRY